MWDILIGAVTWVRDKPNSWRDGGGRDGGGVDGLDMDSDEDGRDS